MSTAKWWNDDEQKKRIEFGGRPDQISLRLPQSLITSSGIEPEALR